MSVRANEKIKLAVLGASGRMGARILALAETDQRFAVIAGVEKPDSAFVGKHTHHRTPIVGQLEGVLPTVDAVIDFTAPESVPETAKQVAKHGRALVVGTTGLPENAIDGLKAVAKKIPVVFSPNMSVGVNLLFRLVEEAAKALAHYDIEIIEAHHNQKKDAPSGTAMKLAELAAEASGRASADFEYGRRGLVGARKKKEIGVLAVRAGDIVGDHTVLFCGGGERLELTHRAHSRDAFASGALDAAAWAARAKPGFYSMKDVLKL